MEVVTILDSYTSFNEGKIKIGHNSLVQNEICDYVIRGIDNSNCGARIKFGYLSEDIFASYVKASGKDIKYNNESYAIIIEDDITILHTSEITKLYALYAIKRYYTRDGISKGIILNSPRVEFRCFRSYLPGKRNIDSFKKFIDMLIAYGHNALMLEIGGAMEYKRHPEINDGWVEYCKIFEEYNGKTEDVQRIYKFPKNAIHSDNGEGEYLTYEELKEITDYCNKRHIEIIPEVPSLCHVDYLLYNHPELSEDPEDLLPNNACPSNEEYYKLIFDVLDEVIEVFNPKRINICHDEAYVYGVCPKCKGKDPAKIFGDDIIKMYDYLKSKGVKTMIWGDKIIKAWHGGNAAYHWRHPWEGKTVNVQGKELKVRGFSCNSGAEWAQVLKEHPDAEAWYVPATYSCIDRMPKDLEVMNWSWSVEDDSEDQLAQAGLYQVYGNFTATGMKNFAQNIAKGVKGVSFSNWGRTDFEALQRTNSLFGLAINAMACWNIDYIESNREENTFKVMNSIYEYLNYDTLKGPHIEITHTTNAVIDHDFFYDGYVIIKDDFHIGDYEITYTDGTKEVYPIHWGHNIGNSDIYWGNRDANSLKTAELGGYVVKYIYEPAGISCPVVKDDKTYYKFVIPNDKEVLDIKLIPKDEYNVNFVGYKKVV